MAAGTNAKNTAGTVDFQALVLGFSSAALYYMGESVVEGRGQAEKNLPLAKQNIDILLLLKNKTKGNLAPDESRLLEQALADLELKFVDASK
jgi:hypothetical protein